MLDGLFFSSGEWYLCDEKWLWARQHLAGCLTLRPTWDRDQSGSAKEGHHPADLRSGAERRAQEDSWDPASLRMQWTIQQTMLLEKSGVIQSMHYRPSGGVARAVRETEACAKRKITTIVRSTERLEANDLEGESNEPQLHDVLIANEMVGVGRRDIYSSRGARGCLSKTRSWLAPLARRV